MLRRLAEAGSVEGSRKEGKAHVVKQKYFLLRV